MSQAKPKEDLTVVTVQGFEPLFEPPSSTPTDTGSNTPSNTPATVVTVTTTPTGWTLKMASENLGLSMNTIRKRIKDRELHGYKVTGPNGPEWRITPPQGTPSNTSSITPTESVTVTSTPTIEALLKVIENQTKQIDASAEQLKAASQVIMYQKLQLEERDEQIKLLTDSQHKQGWWPRLKSWLTSDR